MARRGEGGFQGGPGLQGREGVLEKSRGFAPLLRHDPGGAIKSAADGVEWLKSNKDFLGRAVDSAPEPYSDEQRAKNGSS